MKKGNIKSKLIDGDQFIDPDTGSTLSSEIGEGNIPISIPTKTHYTHSSKKYSKIDEEAMLIILSRLKLSDSEGKRILREVDLGYFLALATMMNTQCMLVSKNHYVYDLKSISKKLKLKEKTFSRTFGFLERNNLIAISKQKHPLLGKRIICINPYILRKESDVELFVTNLFEDPRKTKASSNTKAISLNHIKSDFDQTNNV